MGMEVDFLQLFKEVGTPVGVCAFLGVVLRTDLKDLVKSVSEQSKSIVELVSLIKSDREEIRAIWQTKISTHEKVNDISVKIDKLHSITEALTTTAYKK